MRIRSGTVTIGDARSLNQSVFVFLTNLILECLSQHTVIKLMRVLEDEWALFRSNFPYLIYSIERTALETKREIVHGRR